MKDDALDIMKSNMVRLLQNIGDRGLCRGCGATIYWIVHKNRKKAPYNSEGANHFSDCPTREMFRKETPAS